MTANKQEVIDMINDEVQFTKTNIKAVSNVLVKSDSLFQTELLTAKDEKYFSKEDWAHIEASIKRQMKSAF
jgi:hypothetical protein